jgi:hypothetical protein
VVSFDHGGRIAVESQPGIAWIAVGGVVLILAAMLVGVVLYGRRSRHCYARTRSPEDLVADAYKRRALVYLLRALTLR